MIGARETLQEAATRLEARKSGDVYKFLCPCHEDHNPSAYLTTSKAGHVVADCYVCKNWEKVTKACGLWMEPHTLNGGHRRAEKIARACDANIRTTYDYRDESGALLYQTVRFEEAGRKKTFRQRRPVANGWDWRMEDVRRVPYRLPELVNAQDTEWVFVVEGEKDAENLASRGLVATCNVGGAGKWRAEYNRFFDGRKVAILGDNDAPGATHAKIVAKALQAVATCVRVVELPGLPAKGDVSDWFEMGGTVTELLAKVEETLDWQPADAGAEEGAGDDSDDGDDSQEFREEKGKGREPSQADKLVRLALLNARFFTSNQDGSAYASVATPSGARHCYMLDSDAFRNYLSALFYQHYGSVISAQARADCCALLAFEAHKERADVWLRVGYSAGKVYIDMATDDGSAIEVDEVGWRIVKTPPVHFRRLSSMLPLPVPVDSQEPLLLKKYLNILDSDWLLIAAWLITSMHPRGPYPVLAFLSRAGSGKSTQLRVLKRIIDPSAAELRSQPTDIRDLFIAASNSWIVAFDNVSRLSSEISDALCVISTGGGFTRKANYTNSDETILHVQRPIMLNGIGDVIGRQDLMDRAIVISTPYIGEEQRRDETEFWRDFEEDKAAILGAFLNALSVGLANVGKVRLEKKPRMADFARLAVAAESAFVRPGESFIEAYTENRDDAAATIVENSPLGDVLLRVLGSSTRLSETPHDLYTRLAAEALEFEKRADGFPRHHNQLKEALERIAPALERQDIRVEHERKKTGRRIHIYRKDAEVTKSSLSLVGS